MLGCSLKVYDFPETALVDEALLLAFPEVLLVLFGQWSQERQVIDVVLENQLWLLFPGLDKLAVGQKSREQGRPVWMHDFLLHHSGTEVRNHLLENAVFIVEHWLHAWRSILHRRYRDRHVGEHEVRHCC